MRNESHYQTFLAEVTKLLPQERIYTDELRLLAWGTDAGFYRLTPRVVIRSENEEEVAKLIELTDRFDVPVTFRAAGTSLSGQAITDSVLIVAGKHWEKYSLSSDAKQITLQPGIVGGRVNQILKPYGRKFAPDPASLNSAMVGGIVMNNASGMSCGTHANSDRVLCSVRMILPDGTLLDTGDAESRKAFANSHPSFLARIVELRDRVRDNSSLSERIRHKYSIKNVTGLNILPFVFYDDPFDIIAHLLVGSEGTLAFLSEVTMNTIRQLPYKASAMLYFSDIREACRAVVALKGLVTAAELLDQKSLASVNDTTGVGLTAILTQVEAQSQHELAEAVFTVQQQLQDFTLFVPARFTDVESEYAKYWAIRSGIFPSVGGTRPLGTTCLIEDVAFHLEHLPEATAELQVLLARHGYDDACIYGHALEGNFHFIINQSFSSKSEVERYEALMEDVKRLVVDRYDGSLKAEHGTGRNMAPFVRDEWGDEAFALMKDVKQLFDPKGLFNPGVIFNDDPRCYLKNFKPLPLLEMRSEELKEANAKANRCIECGFCEVNCVSCGFTLSSRQRIVIQREISYLQQSGEDNHRLETLQKQYHYLGDATCAGDGLCSMSCPMGINTGDLTHAIRQSALPKKSVGYRIGDFVACHFAGTKKMLRATLTLADVAHRVLGTKIMKSMTHTMHQVLGIPLWTPAMPKAFSMKADKQKKIVSDASLKVVYFPSCLNQTMGNAAHSVEKQPLVQKTISLLQKAGYEVIFPKQMDNLCCGTIWESKGMLDIADRKIKELEKSLWEASEQGLYPVLCDQSPCLHRMREKISSIKLYEPAEFIYTFLRSRLTFEPKAGVVALHITCSMRRMGLADTLIAVAKLCSAEVLVPQEVGCCGFAGDRGFTYPELNAYALRKLRPQIEAAGIKVGYSNSRTCEIGLTTNSGIPYVSIVYLVDQCTTPKI